MLKLVGCASAAAGADSEWIILISPGMACLGMTLLTNWKTRKLVLRFLCNLEEKFQLLKDSRRLLCFTQSHANHSHGPVKPLHYDGKIQKSLDSSKQ